MGVGFSYWEPHASALAPSLSSSASLAKVVRKPITLNRRWLHYATRISIGQQERRHWDVQAFARDPPKLETTRDFDRLYSDHVYAPQSVISYTASCPHQLNELLRSGRSRPPLANPLGEENIRGVTGLPQRKVNVPPSASSKNTPRSRGMSPLSG